MTAATEVGVRPSSALVPAMDASVEAFRHAQQAARQAWEQQVSDAMPCTSLDDDLWVDGDCDWVSPMAGLGLEPVVTDWAGLNWAKSGRAA